MEFNWHINQRNSANCDLNANKGLMWQIPESAIRSQTAHRYRCLPAAATCTSQSGGASKKPKLGRMCVAEAQSCKEVGWSDGLWSWRESEGGRKVWWGLFRSFFLSSVRPSVGVSGPFVTSLARVLDTFRPFHLLTITPRIISCTLASSVRSLWHAASSLVRWCGRAANDFFFSLYGCKELPHNSTGKMRFPQRHHIKPIFTSIFTGEEQLRYVPLTRRDDPGSRDKQNFKH